MSLCEPNEIKSKRFLKKFCKFSNNRVLTRKLQLGLSGPNWESECNDPARVSMPKWSLGVLGGALSPPSRGLRGRSLLEEILRP